MGGDAALADQVAQLGGQGRRQPGHQGRQAIPEPAALRHRAAAELTPTGEQHRRLSLSQQGLKLQHPVLLQGSQQGFGEGPLQHPRQPGHGQLDPDATGLPQQQLQLGIGQGHMGAHQHQPRQRLPALAPAAPLGQTSRIPGLVR